MKQCSPSEIAYDTNLANWGLDWLGMLRLVERWPRHGVRVDVADMSGTMTIAHRWRLANLCTP